MTIILKTLRRTSLLMMALTLFAGWVVADITILAQNASAAMITSRSLKLSSSANGSVTTATPGDGGNGQKAKHTVEFTMATGTATMGSIAIIYCDNPIPQTACTSSTAATGNASNLTAATLSATAGTAGGTGWALDTTTSNPTITNYGTCNGSGTTRQNCVLLKASSAGANSAGTVTIRIAYGGGASDYITNPTTDNATFYARIVVFSDTGYTTVVDNGSVANSTAQQIDVTAKVQETLNFSVGAPDGTVDLFPAPGTTCAPFTDDGALPLGDSNGVLSFTTAYDAHSYFRISTNANGGAYIYYSGGTLTNSTGSGDISAIGTTATNSTPGTEQFGLGLDSGDTNQSLTDIVSGGEASYNQAAGLLTNSSTKFAFDTASVTTPVAVAHSAGPIVCDTAAVRYLGNISTTVEPGIYTTKLTYIAAPVY